MYFNNPTPHKKFFKYCISLTQAFRRFGQFSNPASIYFYFLSPKNDFNKAVFAKNGSFGPLFLLKIGVYLSPNQILDLFLGAAVVLCFISAP